MSADQRDLVRNYQIFYVREIDGMALSFTEGGSTHTILPPLSFTNQVGSTPTILPPLNQDDKSRIEMTNEKKKNLI